MTLRSLQATQAIEARLSVSDAEPTMFELCGVGCRILLTIDHFTYYKLQEADLAEEKRLQKVERLLYCGEKWGPEWGMRRDAYPRCEGKSVLTPTFRDC